MNKLDLIESQVLSANFLAVCSIIESLESGDFTSLWSYNELDLKTRVGLDRLSTDDYLDDLTFSLLYSLSPDETVELLNRLKPHRIASPEAILFLLFYHIIIFFTRWVFLFFLCTFWKKSFIIYKNAMRYWRMKIIVI